MSPVVAVIGKGIWADFVKSELSSRYEIKAQPDFKTAVPQMAKLVLVLQDGWDPSVNERAEEALRTAGIPWLSGFITLDEAVIGPLVRPGKPGCSQCADTRRLTAWRERKLSESQMMRLIQGESMNEEVSRTAIMQAACLLCEETDREMQGRGARTEGQLYMIDLQTLNCSLHFFLPDPLCAVCGQLSADSPTEAEIPLKPSPKIDPDSYRCRSIEELRVNLKRDYLDCRTGLFNKKMIDFVTPFADVYVNLPLFMANEVTAGRSLSYEDSESGAILEGLERYCGLEPRRKKTAVHDSFRNLSDQALDPVTVGLYSQEQYAQPDFPFERYEPDRSIDWVWGYSFSQQRPILVPASLAYYSSGHGDDLVNETSNGCALGSTLQEAVFYGILEVIERDSFLMTWYAQLPVPRLDPFSANDRSLRLMIERFQAIADVDVHLFNTTMENGMPSIWALARNRKSEGIHLLCNAASHPDPLRAAKSAIHELAGQRPMFNERYADNEEESVRMFHDSSLVREMGDHSVLYGLPQAEKRLHFLMDKARPLQTFDEAFKKKEGNADLTDDLKCILAVFDRLKLDVIAVDQSSPETLRNGLHCVKVLIPGMLPITFGHHLTRVTGLERVLTVPSELGYVKKPLTLSQLNPHPHPFP